MQTYRDQVSDTENLLSIMPDNYKPPKRRASKIAERVASESESEEYDQEVAGDKDDQGDDSDTGPEVTQVQSDDENEQGIFSKYKQ
jgi:hypothetical protein